MHKWLKKLVREPIELRFSEVEEILIAHRYRFINSRGSHFRFKKTNAPSITIVVHHNKVKKWYIKRMCKILLSQYYDQKAKKIWNS